MARMDEFYEWFRIRVICLFVLFVFPGVQSAFAHAGGTLQLAGVPAGPYLVTVWTSPPDARANSPLHVTVGVADVETDEIVLDAQIEVRVELLDNPGTAMSGAATIEQSVSKLLYETAEFPIVQSGNYRVHITIIGAKGQGEAAFDMQVLPALHTNWLVWSLIGLGGIAAVFLFRSWRRQTTDQPATIPSRPQRKRPSVD